MDQKNIDFRDIIQQIRDGIFITDKDRKILFWSQSAEDLTGYSASEMTGQACDQLGFLCSRDPEGNSLCTTDKCPLLKAMESSKTRVYPRLFFFTTKWKSSLPVSLTIGPVHDPNDEISGALCIFKDMRDEYRQRKLAGEIQKKMITTGNIMRQGLSVEIIYKPVEDVSRNFLEAFFLDDNTLVATLADVKGQGVSPPFFTVIYKTLFHSAFSRLKFPKEVLQYINQSFLLSTPVEGSLLSASMISYDPESSEGRIASAGNPPALIFKKSGGGFDLKKVLDVTSGMIGADEDADFSESPFSLEKNEFILLSSDGLFNAEGADGNPFGIEGVKRFFSTYKGQNPMNDLISCVQNESAFPEFLDDLSLISITAV
ncbi:MAG: SpoIIE family protein phosphatase [Spirochaetales bacterium]|nr:SpoIIE family protein phosphatase [Spirochaetales bacterium]